MPATPVCNPTRGVTAVSYQTRIGTYRLQHLKPDGTTEAPNLVGERVTGEKSTTDVDRGDLGDVDDALSLNEAVAHACEHSRRGPDSPVLCGQLDSVALSVSEEGKRGSGQTHHGEQDGEPSQHPLPADPVGQASFSGRRARLV